MSAGIAPPRVAASAIARMSCVGSLNGLAFCLSFSSWSLTCSHTRTPAACSTPSRARAKSARAPCSRSSACSLAPSSARWCASSASLARIRARSCSSRASAPVCRMTSQGPVVIRTSVGRAGAGLAAPALGAPPVTATAPHRTRRLPTWHGSGKASLPPPGGKHARICRLKERRTTADCGLPLYSSTAVRTAPGSGAGSWRGTCTGTMTLMPTAPTAGIGG